MPHKWSGPYNKGKSCPHLELNLSLILYLQDCCPNFSALYLMSLSMVYLMQLSGSDYTVFNDKLVSES